MTTIQIILLLVIAAITGMGSVLDEGQTHRPLVACTLVGWVLGDMTTGIILGGTLEMMALGWMNVGLAMAPDTAIASVISTILVINTNQGIGEGIAIAVALAAAGQALTIFVRTMTVFLIHRADTYAEKGNMRGIEIMHITALGFQALRVMIPTFVVVMMSVDSVQAMLNGIPPVVTHGLQIGGGIIVVVGYAMVINMMSVKYLMPFFFCRFLDCGFYQFQPCWFRGNGISRCVAVYTAESKIPA
ncbi:PTS system mannose-specific transporter subunit IIC [Klebsiella michiganensis HKOPL1]|nr:PTS system mannose-specific transporter subunit IIC [Klebsiella michiganensis HKOPL1]